MLVIEVGRAVPAHRLVDLLWDEPIPTGSMATLRSHVANLRRLLEPGRGRDPGVLVTVGAGSTAYQLRLPSAKIDAYRFTQLVNEGLRLARADDPTGSTVVLREALTLWRGPAFANVAERPFAAPQIARLTELRRVARRAYAEAMFGLGRYGEILGELADAVADNPFDEAQRRLLALALYREQRVNEAAQVCRQGVALLRSRGIDAPALETLHRTILRREVPTTGHPGTLSNPPAAPPCLLPAALPRLVGRDVEFEQVRRHLLDPKRRPVTVVVTGPAGTGKTSLVVAVGHSAAVSDFPDGQLYADLHGVHPEPAEPTDVLGGFLRALGGRGQAVPDNHTERVQLYRTLLARRRVLVVLDNAADARQVQDLLPNGTGCAALVSSRTGLAGLHGIRVALPTLTADHALALLGEIIGLDRIAAHPMDARAVVELCDGLPLAVWVAGARLAIRPHWSLVVLHRALADERRRLDELTVGDVAVRASIELSYRRLDAEACRALRSLGLVGADDIAAWALAALLDTPPVRAERLLDDLHQVHLIEVASTSPAGTRYRMPSLVRLVAFERSRAEDSEGARSAALRRLLAAALDLAGRADAALSADFLGLGERRPPEWRLPQDEVDRLIADPLSWFGREHDFLAATLRDGLGAEVTDLAGRLAAALTTFFQIRCLFDEWRRTQSRAINAVVASGDQSTALKLHRSLGELDTIQDRYPDAIAHFQAAIGAGLHHEPDHEAAVTSGLGYLYRLLGQYRQAQTCFQRAAKLSERVGNANSLVYALAGIGVVHLEEGRLAPAEAHFDRALRLSKEVGYRPGEAQALRGLGHVARARVDHAAAVASFRAAMHTSCDLGDRLGEAHAASWLGEALFRQGLHGDGRRLLARCLWVYREHGNAWGEAATLCALAEAQLAVGRAKPAFGRATVAVKIWRRIGSPYWLSKGLDVLAETLLVLGDCDQARDLRAEADLLRASTS
ncbi:BTAD domain-containing putative transcriptional regulator [Micromonospora zamorensis]|uniref:AfsR/SARP family transcriptional regulator n=1 Tax=Micromonospora zamorensis TaxID=709883 RepID=UPI003D92A0FB